MWYNIIFYKSEYVGKVKIISMGATRHIPIIND